MKRFLSLLIVCLASFTGYGATIQWYHQQPATANLKDGDIVVLETTPSAYKSFTLLSLKNWIGTNGPSTFYITNLVVNNLYGSNAYFTNVYVTQEFHGKTSFIENSYITNLYTQYLTTNYYLFSTNIYLSYPTFVNNSYVSNYFQTNVFQNTYMSNFFNTNIYHYVTNVVNYSTNLTVTNFYAGDTYVSNFFNTNVFVNNSIVSNFFTTNLYNTINIQSNYTYNVAWPLTNATLYGTTTFSPVTGNQAGYLVIRSTNADTITLSGSNGVISANQVLFKTNRWDGPTNNWPMMNGEEQYYVTYTDVNVTNFSSLPPSGYGWNGLLVVSNAASTNITWRFLSTLGIPERTTSVTVSNASKGMMSGKWSPATGTNGVYRQF